MTLIERIKAARLRDIKTGGVTLTLCRPTDFQMLEMSDSGGVTRDQILKKFVVDWKDVKESDLIEGGADTPVNFNAELFVEWVSDHPETWEDICNTVVQMYKDHEEKTAVEIKN